MELDVEDEDVDVVFEDSVLHQALLDCGITYLETESRAKMEGDECQNEQNTIDQEENGDHIESTSHRHSSLLARLVFSSDFLCRLYHQRNYRVLQRLMTSRILSAEDRQFLQDFVEETSETMNPEENFNIWTKRVIGFLLVMTLILNISPVSNCLAPLIVLCLEAFITVDTVPAYHIYLGMALINFAWCCLVVCLTRLLYQQLKRELIESAHGQENPFSQLESEAWELLHLERKCLRLLRESELVARGFTLASQRQASSHQAAGQRSAVDQLCPQLRQTMLTYNTEVLAKIKLAVTTMMKSVPMKVSDSDFSTIEDLPELDLVSTQEENAENVIPLAPISKSVSLLQIYLSGCMRRLALCFYQRNLRDSSLNPFVATAGCIQSCTDAIVHARSELQEHHSFYRAIHRSMSQRNSTDDVALQRYAGGRSTGADSSSDRLQHFCVCVKSLDLHLQSVLLMTRDLSLNLEALLDQEARDQVREDGGPTIALPGQEQDLVANTTSEDWTLWEETLKRVKTSLDSVQCCHEECMKHLSHRDKAPENQSSAEPSEPPTANWREMDQAPVKVIPAEDPVILDQVFEAETEAAGDSDEEDMVEWRRQRQEAAQQRARIQERRETMRHLRQELSAVVGHRAILHREREKQALARARGELAEEEKAEDAGVSTESDQTPILENGISNGDADEMKDVSDFKGRNGIKNGIVDHANHQDYEQKSKSEEASELKCVHDNVDAKGDLETEHTALTQGHREKLAKDGEMTEERKQVYVNGGAVQVRETNGHNQSDNGLLGLKDIVWQKVCADVHQSRTIDQNGHKKNGLKYETSKSENQENGVDKSNMVENMRFGLEADPSICVKIGEAKDSEIVPGIPYSALNGHSNGDTHSLGVGKGGNTRDLGGENDATSDTRVALEHFWKKPAPPRVHKTGGTLYVTPVNLITVGYAFHGDIGEGPKDDDEADGAEDGGDGTGGNNDNDPVDDGNNVVSGNVADENVEGDGVKGDKKSGEGGACGGVQPGKRKTGAREGDRKGVIGGARPRSHSLRVPKSRVKRRSMSWIPKSDPGARRNKERQFTNKKSRKATRRCNTEDFVDFQKMKMMKNFWFSCEQDLLGVRIEKLLRWRRRNRFLTYTERRSNPFMSPNNDESDDGGPDQDLVGGLRFSPEDPSRDTMSPESDLTQSTPQSQTWTTGSPWLRRFLRQPPGPPMSLRGLPLRGVVDGENGDEFQDQPTVRSHFSIFRGTRAAVASARREFNSYEILTEQANTPDLRGSYSNQLRSPLSLSPIPSTVTEGARYLENLVEPESDPWVKITHVKMENENSEVEVIRQKEIDLRTVLALRQAPPPSPNHDSSFTRELAKMAAAQANRIARSDNQNILGAEETFGDNSSSDDDGL